LPGPPPGPSPLAEITRTLGFIRSIERIIAAPFMTGMCISEMTSFISSTCRAYFGNAVGAVLGLNNAIPVRLQNELGDIAHGSFIIDDQDQFVPADRHRLVGGGRLMTLGSGLRCRKIHFHGRTSAHLAVEVDKSTVIANDCGNRGQAESRSLTEFLGREKRLENLLSNFRRHAMAAVLDLDNHERPAASPVFIRAYDSSRSALRALIASVPPSGIASRAFTHRFIKTC
jgi:hypothetical protein